MPKAERDQPQCEVCGQPTAEKVVQVTMWSGGQLVVVENVPSRVCEMCEEQYYDDETGQKILTLASAGFPREKAVREIVVPVFSIEGIVVSHSQCSNLSDEDDPFSHS